MKYCIRINDESINDFYVKYEQIKALLIAQKIYNKL